MDTVYWIWLANALGYGSRAIKPLLEKFDSVKDIFEATEEDLSVVSLLSSHEKKKLLTKDLTMAEEVAEYCLRGSVRVLTMTDDDYPPALLSIENPPAVLYCRGKIPKWKSFPCIAVVGARAMSYYGASASCEIAYDLGRMGCITVSGMAFGIDGVSAAATLEAGGVTVAVLGSGIDRPYPKEHGPLYRAILENGGLIMTEFPPYEGADGFHFPLRNRIISGISQGLILVEGEAESGALITARYAKRQGRAVFAVPGKINDKNSEAPHLLLKQDAKVLTCADDVYDTFKDPYFASINPFILLSGETPSVEAVIRKYSVAVGKPKTRTKKVLSGNAVQTDGNGQKNGIVQKIRNLFHGEAAPEQTDTFSAEEIAKVENLKEERRKRLDENRKKRLTARTYAVYEKLSYDTPRHPDEIIVENVHVSDITAELVMMEISGDVAFAPGGCYVKSENE